MIPHPVLPEWYRRPEEKPAFINTLFDQGAAHYDRVVDWGFLHSGARYRRSALNRHGLRPGLQMLDVACGTGQVAAAAAQILGSAQTITCLDPSEGMLAVARARLDARFVVGRAESLPFPDDSFDFITMGYALRHVVELEQALGEFRRVLKPGGTLLIMEITKPRSRIGAFLFRLYFGRLYPVLAQFITRSREARAMMEYFWQTMDACVPPTSIRADMRGAGLDAVRSRTLAGIFTEYCAQKACASPSVQAADACSGHTSSEGDRLHARSLDITAASL